ncbi:uncharacterized protein PV06_02249 [Exophiala oligosperma]|uniref:Major facilitator superfamily (MFS) profile domain-containing protein n=1 Tax=Exophiala oligosperma TaxID=215243 RepID=A0A0D2EF88_9EURO|nr:uncharacterized protein PV06_02249 [Exophiala oligosperma]KIW46584.1 hypothetical protein PV06_02249 [Exophiala oligosperma]
MTISEDEQPRQQQQSTESQPLLQEPTPENTAHKPPPSRTIFWKLYALVFCINIAFQILIPAQTEVFENIYCKQWYHKHPRPDLPAHGPVPESFCKISPVQTQVSSLKGWLEVSQAVPGLLLSIPIGVLADRIGRRHIFIANASSIFLMQVWITAVTWLDGRFPLRTVWLSGAFGLFTGGTIVTEMLFVCILSDISPEGRLADAFFRATSFSYLGRMLGPFVAGILMRWSPWYPVYLGLGILGFTIIVVLSLPETLHLQNHNDEAEETTSEHEEGPQTTTTPPAPPKRGGFSFADSQMSIRRVLKIWSDWRLVFVALTLPFKIIYYALNDLVQRYVSDRYGWTLANATLLYSIQAAATTVMLLTILPLMSNYIDSRFSISVLQKNVVMTRASLFVLALAYAVTGLAPNPIIMVIGMFIETLSTGLPATMRALAAALVSNQDKGTVFSVMAVAETLSTMMAYPVTAMLFNIGLEHGGGAWLGLPYDFVSVAAAFAGIIMCLLRFERPVRIP